MVKKMEMNEATGLQRPIRIHFLDPTLFELLPGNIGILAPNILHLRRDIGNITPELLQDACEEISEADMLLLDFKANAALIPYTETQLEVDLSESKSYGESSLACGGELYRNWDPLCDLREGEERRSGVLRESPPCAIAYNEHKNIDENLKRAVISDQHNVFVKKVDTIIDDFNKHIPSQARNEALSNVVNQKANIGVIGQNISTSLRNQTQSYVDESPNDLTSLKKYVGQREFQRSAGEGRRSEYRETDDHLLSRTVERRNLPNVPDAKERKINEDLIRLRENLVRNQRQERDAISSDPQQQRIVSSDSRNQNHDNLPREPSCESKISPDCKLQNRDYLPRETSHQRGESPERRIKNRDELPREPSRQRDISPESRIRNRNNLSREPSLKREKSPDRRRQNREYSSRESSRQRERSRDRRRQNREYSSRDSS